MEGLSGLFGAATSIATGNPVGAALSIAGVGLSIFGGMEKTEAAQRQASIQQQMTGIEMRQDAVRRKAMELSARRQQMEVLRNAQRARSLALNNATSQGAQYGSGLQGGFGQIAGATQWNLTGIRENLNFGEQMFDLNAQLSQQKIAMAQAGGQAATAQGMSSLGTSLVGAAGPAKNLWSTFGPSGTSSPSTTSGWAVGSGAAAP